MINQFVRRHIDSARPIRQLVGAICDVRCCHSPFVIGNYVGQEISPFRPYTHSLPADMMSVVVAIVLGNLIHNYSMILARRLRQQFARRYICYE